MTGSIDAHMRESDALMWSLERSPMLRSTIVLTLLLDGQPSTEELADRLERLSRVAPLFRQHVVEERLHLAAPMFVVDNHFDVHWHLRRFEAAQPRTFGSLLEEAAKIGTTAFDPARPLWECTVVDGIEGGKTALVFKVHHSLTDGVGGIHLLTHMLDFEPVAPERGPMPALPPPPDAGSGSVREALDYTTRQVLGVARFGTSAVMRTAYLALRQPTGTARDLVTTTKSVMDVVRPAGGSTSPLFGPRGADRRYAVIDVPTEHLKAAAHAAGGTLNDAFIAALTGGLRIYHERHRQPLPKLAGSVPISVRTAADPLAGNRIAAVRFLQDAAVADPAERIRATHERMRILRNDKMLPYMEAVAGVVNRLPTAYLTSSTTQLDFQASNVPGIPQNVYCAGANVLALYPFGPTIGAPFNATLMSYAGTCHIGVNIDTSSVPDCEEMMSCLQAGLDEVLALAG